MKYFLLTLIFFISFQFLFAQTAGDSTQTKIPISIKVGLKFPEDYFYRSTTFGFTSNLSFKFDLGKSWYLLPTFILWHSNYKKIDINHKSVTVTTFTGVVSYEYRISSISIMPKTGLGLGSSSGSDKKLLTLIYGITLNYFYESNIKLQLELLKQHSAAFDVGGSGPSFNIFLLLIGFEFEL
jgi:hypothetical protein